MAPVSRAVVVGLASVTGLQTARLLAARGISVIGLAGNSRHFAARTRVCERIIQADVHGIGLVDVLKQLGPELDAPAVLYPCTDRAVLAISSHRDALEQWYRIALPDDALVRSLTHKATFYDIARDAGLSVPETFALHSRAEAVRAAQALPYPCVLKPSVKSNAWNRHTGAKVLLVNGPDELLQTYDRVCQWTDALVAQQYIDGDDGDLYTCNAYFDAEHRALVSFVTRKHRQWPPHVGTATLADECRNDVVLAQTLQLFQSVGFRGLGYLELKHDRRTGRHFVMEANIGRPTGRSATAEAGGVELLRTMYCDALGLPLPAEREQRYIGAAWMDVRRDVLSASYYLRRGELSPADWYRSLRRPKVHAVFSRRDPMPFAFELAQSTRKAVRRALRRAKARTNPVSRRHGLGREPERTHAVPRSSADVPAGSATAPSRRAGF